MAVFNTKYSKDLRSSSPPLEEDVEDGIAVPSRTLDVYWIYCSTAKQVNQCPNDGKWMMFFDKRYLDAEWRAAQNHYLSGNLTGICSMKCSTAKDNSRASASATGVVIFYCGPAINEERVIQIGKNLLYWIKCISTCGYMYYKSDHQTLLGTRATGIKRNWLYRLDTSAAKRITNAELLIFSQSNADINKQIPENTWKDLQDTAAGTYEIQGNLEVKRLSEDEFNYAAIDQSKAKHINRLQVSKVCDLAFTAVGMRYKGDHVFTSQDQIRIEADDYNSHDKNAVKVMVKKAGKFVHVAYAVRGDCQKLRCAMEENGQHSVYFVERYAQSAKLALHSCASAAIDCI